MFMRASNKDLVSYEALFRFHAMSFEVYVQQRSNKQSNFYRYCVDLSTTVVSTRVAAGLCICWRESLCLYLCVFVCVLL